ncbi:hypothetical protein [Candidatus Nitrosotenuis cloacae]|uniref:hypothetical protein n=1 Tax=Candidatus Nitrosotenuis cloacae TaxID=1603555 RepID=UPI00227E8AB4|nr:hypothetical protein [Candidatus Nitrosotenuis cloacae]
MKLATLISEEIKTKYPHYQELPLSHQKTIARNIIKKAIVSALPKINIPTPPSPFKRALQEIRMRRRSAHYKKTHNPINYDLWEMIYKYKKNLLSAPANDSKFERIEVATTNLTSRSHMAQNNIPLSVPEYDLNQTTTKNKFFKVITDENAFSSVTKIKEEINNFENLLNSSLQYVEKKKISELNMLVLYDLNRFVAFIERLERFSTLPRNKSKSKPLINASYSILRNHLFNLLKESSPQITSSDQLEKFLLSDEDFRLLDISHPFREGFTKLFHHTSIPLLKTVDLKTEKLSKILLEQARSNDEKPFLSKHTLESLHSEILREIYKNKGKIALISLQRKFLFQPYSVKKIVDNLENDGLIMQEKTDSGIIIRFKNS